VPDSLSEKIFDVDVEGCTDPTTLQFMVEFAAEITGTKDMVEGIFPPMGAQ
jgi:hypothetical protein